MHNKENENLLNLVSATKTNIKVLSNQLHSDMATRFRGNGLKLQRALNHMEHAMIELEHFEQELKKSSYHEIIG